MGTTMCRACCDWQETYIGTVLTGDVDRLLCYIHNRNILGWTRIHKTADVDGLSCNKHVRKHGDGHEYTNSWRRPPFMYNVIHKMDADYFSCVRRTETLGWTQWHTYNNDTTNHSVTYVQSLLQTNTPSHSSHYRTRKASSYRLFTPTLFALL